MRIDQAVRMALASMALAVPFAGTAYAADAVTTQPETLPEVQVSAGQEEETARTEVRGYVAKRALTATKTDTSILETPQSISVVTSDQIEDQQAQSLQEVLRYSAGVVADQYGLDSRSDGYAVRGNSATQYLNGLRSLNNYYTETTRPDPYTLERVEILRGPSSMLYGQGGVGGIVNVVSKRPQEEAAHEMGIILGNYDHRQIRLDSTGSINEDGTLLYRLVALTRYNDTQVDYADNRRMVLAPSLTWKPSEDTSLTLLAQYQRDDGRSTPGFLPAYGVLLPNPNGKIDYDTFLSDPDFDKYETESNQIGWAFEHAFNDMWTVRQNLRYTSSNNEYRSLYVNSFAGGKNPFTFNPITADPNQRILPRFVDASKSDAKTFNVDTNAQANFVTGNFEHTLLMGLDYGRFRQQISGYSAFGYPIDVFDPVYTPVDRSNVTHYKDPLTRQHQTGVYVQDQIKFDNWIATLGLRHDRAKNQAEGEEDRVDRKTTGRYGLTYVFDSGWAPYVSYAESFLPVQGTGRNGALHNPQEGEQWEVGIKYQPEGSRSRFMAAIYDMRDTNRLTPDPNGGNFSVQQGEIRTRGLEIEALLAFDNRFDLIAAYSYTDAEYSKSNDPAEKEGGQVEAIPEHLASIWGIKRFAINGLDGFRAGLGVRYIGSSYNSNNTWKTPDVTLVDAMLGLDYGNWRYALNASNLFDKEYVSTCIYRGDCWIGQRRQALASATYYW